MSSTGNNVGDLSVTLGINPAEFNTGLQQAAQATQQSAQVIQAEFQQVSNSIKQAQNQTKQYVETAAAKPKGYGQGMLQASRALQDFQAAGLGGIINNVEGIASGFGMGAGVAGAVTVAAVAIQSLKPLIDSAAESTARFFGEWKSQSDLIKESVTGLMGGGEAIGKLAEIQAERAEFLKKRTDAGSDSWFYSSTYDAARTAMTGKSSDDIALETNMRRASEAAALMQESFRLNADAAREMAAVQRSASAKYDLTTNQKGETALNQQLFQAAVDKYGGGDNLRTKIEQAGIRNGMRKTDADSLYGKFATGDIAAVKQIEGMINLVAEKSKILAEDFEKATGQAEELQRIASKQGGGIDDIIDSMISDAKKEDKRKAIEDEKQNIIGQMADVYYEQEMRKRKFSMIGAEDVFKANAGAGISDPLDPLLKKLDTLGDRLEKVIDKGRRLN